VIVKSRKPFELCCIFFSFFVLEIFLHSCVCNGPKKSQQVSSSHVKDAVRREQATCRRCMLCSNRENSRGHKFG